MNNDEAKQETDVKTSLYEEEKMTFQKKEEEGTTVHMKAVYYPTTGNLYNYMCDLNSTGTTIKNIMVNPGYDYLGESESRVIGFPSQNMCFHYLFFGLS